MRGRALLQFLWALELWGKFSSIKIYTLILLYNCIDIEKNITPAELKIRTFSLTLKAQFLLSGF